ncbi:hypothetical protein ACN6J9_14300 [Carnobacterium maltaromaticum]|uniref:hypothetical protein n=1 Tax=Carnobacterium maltaromaticum TaxID=2751 RepID=UPI003AFAA5FF
MKNYSVLIRFAFALFVMSLLLSGCGNKYKNIYGYWSGVDNRVSVSYDIHITKDYVIMLEDSGATKYKYKKEKIGVRNSIIIPNKELVKNIEGMENSNNSSIILALIEDEGEPYISMAVIMDGTISDANLYSINKKDSPLRLVEKSGKSWIPILMVIGIIIIFYKKNSNKK